MRAIDTNVLVRLIIGDDAKQVAAAKTFLAGGAWISHVVLTETCWVLNYTYGLAPARIAAVVEMLLNEGDVTLQDPDAVVDALKSFRERPALGFADCLILAIARKNGHLPLGTFDRTLGKLEGTQRL